MIAAGAEDWRQNRETPQWLVDYLETAIGAKFTLDAAASIGNAKAPCFWTANTDALSQDWSRVEGWIFCNPPFRTKSEWIEKFATAKRACLVLPCAPCEVWWLQALKSAESVWVINGKRVAFPPGPDAPEEARNMPYIPSGGTCVFVRGASAPGFRHRHVLVRSGKMCIVDGRSVEDA